MSTKTSVDQLEIAKFAEHASQWWDTEGPLKTLHDINPSRIKFVQKYVALSKAHVLDVGCGGGVLSEGMALKGAIVTGLDVEPDAIATAKSHAKQNQLKIKYICQPIEEFNASAFDVVTCMEMLEHVSDPQLVIDHCARLLKTGGYLFLSTINRTWTAYASVIVAAEYVLNLLPRQTHDYDKFIKPSELAYIVRRAGFETIGLSGMAYNPMARSATLVDSIDTNYLMACRRL